MRFSKVLSGVKHATVTIIQWGCVAHCFTNYIAEIAVCSGPSMQPTMVEKDIILIEHISSRLGKFDYGDIIVAKSLKNPKDLICKRITGLPGDKIHYKDLNYVPLGHVWLEGDNRDDSTDSRDFGPVPQGLIKGRIICRIWPVKDIGMLTVKSR